MFDDIQVIEQAIEGTYKKLKSYYYYDKTLLHIKNKIVDFETGNSFTDRMKKLCKNLYEEKQEYFEELINDIDMVIMPKSLKKVDVETKVIKGNIENNKKISKLNFSIDAPVELFIIDMLWMLIVKKLYLQKYGEFEYSYAGKLKKGIMKKDTDIINGIDFVSNRCFEPYFQCYTKWRNKALDVVKEYCKSENILMISLDLKSFYYSVNFDFNSLDVIFNQDERYNNISFLTNIIRLVYKKYTILISKYKCGIKKSDGNNILPIGLISPLLIRDIYLAPIDHDIIDKISPRYYGRYVDDMLIVVKAGSSENLSVEEYINQFLVKNEIIKAKNKADEYEFLKDPSIRLQGEKVNCLFFEKGKDNILIDVYYKNIKRNSSEANLLPDMDVLNESFNNVAYSLNKTDNTGKLRNLEFMGSDNYSATMFINGLKSILKNTTYTSNYYQKFLVDIMKFYSGSQAIEFSDTWKNIFELMVLCRDKNCANQFYSNIKKEIENISFDYLESNQVYSKKKNILLNKLKKSLLLKLDISLSLAIGLDFERGKLKKHKIMAHKMRSANMINHNMVSFPLVNYACDENIKDIPLINMNLEGILSNVSIRKRIFRLDDDKIKWSPRFIHLNELYFCVFYFSIGTEKLIINKDNGEIFKRYLKMNGLSQHIPNPIINEEEKEYDDYNITKKDVSVIECHKSSTTRIGLVNANIDEKEVIDILLHPDRGMSVEKKQNLYKVLNAAKEEGVNYIIFPEFYMPALWLNDVGKFIKQYGITVITGLQYIVCGKMAYNFVCVIKSTCGKTYFRNIIPYFREKNYYAPEERMDLAALGYTCKNPDKAIYYLIGNGFEKFSTILCFEFTDIASRCIMKGKLDFLCVPQLNRDTNYFSSIVEATARDLHTLVVQANTSKYGDSRITGPYKTDFKDILKIKGGENEILIVGKLELKQLQNFRSDYYSKFEKQIDKCLKCKKVHSVHQLLTKCPRCKDKKENIKGLPPNWM